MEELELAEAQVRPASRLWRRKSSAVKVRASAAGVELGDRTIPRGDIEDAMVVPKAHSATVQLGVRNGTDVEIDVPDVATARALLRAIRLDPSHASATFKVGSSMFSGGIYLAALPVAIVAMIFATAFVARRSGIAAVPVALGGFAALFGFLLSQATLKIGAEGVLLSWMHRRLFVPHREIGEVWVEQTTDSRGRRNFVVKLGHQGKVIDMTVGLAGGSRELADTIVERIRDARSGSGPSEDAPGGALDRGDRDARAWLDHLRKVGTGAAADARRAAVSVGRLLEVLDDPQQPQRARIAAAIAAGGSGDAAARTRIQEVASTAASPRFRVALEAAADPEREAELEQILAEEAEEEEADAATAAAARS